MGYSQSQWIRIILFLINHDYLVARFADKSISIQMAAKKIGAQCRQIRPEAWNIWNWTVHSEGFNKWDGVGTFKLMSTLRY